MYDRGKDLNWKSFKDIGFVAAMGKVSSNSFTVKSMVICIQ